MINLSMLDSHVHLSQSVTSFDPHKIYFINSVDSSDWMILQDISSKHQNIIPFYGIHPWYIQKTGDSDLQKLEVLLNQNDAALVGEIGLDRIKAKKDPVQFSLDKQIYYFKEQLKLALKYRRGVSIHCVKAWEELFAVLKELHQLIGKDFKAILHYFNGSVQIMNRLIKQGFFISFFPNLNEQKNPKTFQAFQLCPLDKMFLESDRYIGESEKYIVAHYQNVSLLKKMNFADLKKRMLINGEIFTNRALAGKR